MLLLCLCIVTVIQLTSSQSTYDVIQQENDVNSCGRSEQVLSQLLTAISQLMTAVSQMDMKISQLQGDVAKLKASNQQTAVTGIPEFRWQSNTILKQLFGRNCRI